MSVAAESVDALSQEFSVVSREYGPPIELGKQVRGVFEDDCHVLAIGGANVGPHYRNVRVANGGVQRDGRPVPDSAVSERGSEQEARSTTVRTPMDTVIPVLSNCITTQMRFDYERFLEFEREYDLFDLEAEGIPLWERIRVPIEAQIRRQNGEGTAQDTPDEGLRSYARGLWLATRNLVRKNPFFADRSDIVFLGHPRRKQLRDGKWWDLYVDPLHEGFDESHLHLEFAYQLDHRTPVPTERLRYLDTLKYGGEVLRYLGLRQPSLPRPVATAFAEASTAVVERFDATVDLEARALEELHKRATRLEPYKFLLKRLDPSLLVLTVSYDNELIIEACHDLGIPVAELQHGIIHDQHVGYDFPGERTKRQFPDYLLTFGTFWNDIAAYPLPDDRIVPVGYPYLDQTRSEYRSVETKQQVLFISQGTIGTELSKVAVELASHPEVEFDVVYKLHPGEYDRWKQEYPWLRGSDVDIVASSEPPLYRLFAESAAQVGVYSTALYEGLAFDLETYIYSLPGAKALDPLVESGSATRVSSVDAIVRQLGTGPKSFDREHYFAPDASERAISTIESLASNGTPYR